MLHSKIGSVGVAILASVALAGCYESHTPELPGERYQCECDWTVRIPCEASSECHLTSSGDLECTPTVTCTSSGDTEHRHGRIHPCVTFVDDPEAVCATACADPAYEPEFTEEISVIASSHTGTAMCGGEDESEIYIFPDVPDTATRRGFVVGDMSTFEASIDGIGSSGIVNLVDDTEVAITGSIGEIGESEFQIRSARFTAQPFSIGGHAANNVTLELNDAGSLGTYRQEAEVPPEPFVDSWHLSPGAAMTLDFTGDIDGFVPSSGGEAGIEVTWSNAHGPAQLGFLEPDQFMRFQGSMDRAWDFGDGLRNIHVEGDFFVRFFSGHPFAHMFAMEDGGGSLVVDGRDSIDMLGGSVDYYRWLVRRPTGPSIVAMGPWAVIPRPVWEHIKSDKDARLCLQVQDNDLMLDEICIGLEAFPPPPTVPPPHPPCAELATTFPDARRFGTLLHESGLLPYLEKFGKMTLLLPDDKAMSDMSDQEYESLRDPKNEAKLQKFVLNQMWSSRFSSKDLWKLHQFPTLGDGQVDPGKMPDDVRIPDVDCGEDGVLHMTRTRSH
jgi:hypothetical protein